MRYETVTIRHGEDVGPIDWSHSTAESKPALWREAEKSPEAFRYNGRAILRLRMYDGWPYWEPRPAICFVGPLGSVEWAFFSDYGVHANSIEAAP